MSAVHTGEMLHCHVLYDGVTWRTLLCLHTKQNGSFRTKWFFSHFFFYFTTSLRRVEDEVTSDVKAHVLEGKSAVLILATPSLTSRFVDCLHWRSTHDDTNWSVMNRDPPQTHGPELTASHCQLRSHTQELSDPSACHQCSHCGLQLTGRFNTVTDADDGASDYSAVICYFTQLSCEWVRSEQGTYRPGSKIQKGGRTLEPKPELRLSSSPTQSHSAFLRHGSCDNCLDIKQIFTQNFFPPLTSFQKLNISSLSFCWMV